MKFILLLLLILPLQTDRLASPDGRFQIVLHGKDLSDSSYELNYYLKKMGKSDSTLLTSSFTHDLLAPVFWWTSDSRLLIFEHKEEGNQVSMVKVMDIESGEVRFSSSGFINARITEKDKFLISDHSLLFFKSLERFKVQLFRLNLNNYEIKPLLKFENHDNYETPQIININTKDNEITLLTLENHKYKKIVVRYE